MAGRRKAAPPSAEEQAAKDAWKESVAALWDDWIARLMAATDAVTFERTILDELRRIPQLHRYSFGNVMRAYGQRAEKMARGAVEVGEILSFIAPFGYWIKVNRVPRKGSGLYILRPLIVRKEDAESGEQRSKMVGFRWEVVHDYQDTYVIEGKPDLFGDHLKSGMQWTQVDGDYTPLRDALADVARAQGFTVTYCPPRKRGWHGGVDESGHIYISQLDASGNQAQTLLHELAHAFLHKGRDDYFTDKEVKRQLECQADSIAWCICQYLGLEAPNTPSYLALYGAKSEVIKANLEAIRSGVHLIMGAIEDHAPILIAAPSEEEGAA
jgi:hypothetical protein